MSKPQIKQTLKACGLDQLEIDIYLYLLVHIEATAYGIAKDLGIPRSSAYDKVRSLEKHGLVSSFRKNNKKHFTPESINTLLNKIDHQREQVNDMLPVLRSYIKDARVHQPRVRLLMGKDGVRAAWEEMLDVYKREELREVYATTRESVFDILPRYFKEWVKRRQKLPTKIHLMMPESERGQQSWPQSTTVPEETRYLDDSLVTNGEITVYGDYTALFSFDKKNPHAIVLESPELSQHIENLLKIAWASAEK